MVPRGNLRAVLPDLYDNQRSKLSQVVAKTQVRKWIVVRGFDSRFRGRVVSTNRYTNTTPSFRVPATGIRGVAVRRFMDCKQIRDREGR